MSDSRVKALMSKMGKPFKKVGSYLKDNKARNDAAAKVMDKRHPTGWGQSALNMSEFHQIKKGLKR